MTPAFMERVLGAGEPHSINHLPYLATPCSSRRSSLLLLPRTRSCSPSATSCFLKLRRAGQRQRSAHPHISLLCLASADPPEVISKPSRLIVVILIDLVVICSAKGLLMCARERRAGPRRERATARYGARNQFAGAVCSGMRMGGSYGCFGWNWREKASTSRHPASILGLKCARGTCRGDGPMRSDAHGSCVE
jgi:hypothetical protein